MITVGYSMVRTHAHTHKHTLTRRNGNRSLGWSLILKDAPPNKVLLNHRLNKVNILGTEIIPIAPHFSFADLAGIRVVWVTRLPNVVVVAALVCFALEPVKRALADSLLDALWRDAKTQPLVDNVV